MIGRHGGNGTLQVCQIIADGGEEAFARLGQRELARTALKEANTEIGLEDRDIATDGRGRDGKPALQRKIRRVRRCGQRTPDLPAFPSDFQRLLETKKGYCAVRSGASTEVSIGKAEVEYKLYK
ncbi:hypothetical protein J2W42_005934 [Rhizobium tibeticum]|nr:hypothetical protein [Rhizobium tibeticum]